MIQKVLKLRADVHSGKKSLSLAIIDEFYAFDLIDGNICKERVKKFVFFALYSTY